MSDNENADLFCRSLLSLVPLTVFNAQPSLRLFDPFSAPISAEIRSALLSSFSPWEVFAEYGTALVPRLNIYPAISSLFFSAPRSPHFKALLLCPELPEFTFSYSCPLCSHAATYLAYATHGSYKDALTRILCVHCQATLWPFL